MARRVPLVAVGVAALPVLGLATLGAVGVAERAALAILLVLVSAAAALRGAIDARVIRFTLAGIVVAGAIAVGLIPLPHAALDVVAPGVAVARPDDATWTLSLRPEATRLALATWAVVVGTVVVAVAAGPDRRTWGTVLAWATVAWSAIGAGHALVGTHAWFGLIPVRADAGPWFAPLVDPNHHAAVVLAGAPLVAVELARRRRSWLAIPLVLTLAWAVVVPLATRSMGALLALGVLALAALSTSRATRAVRVGGTVALAVGGAVAAFGVARLAVEWWSRSGAPRLTQWTDTLGMLRAFWLAGTGGGAYRDAYAPFRTVATYQVFDHAHADWLEWVAELGLVGVLAIAALALLPRARGEHVRSWTLSLLALGVAASVDFPLHLPGVAVFAAVLVAVRQAGDAPTTSVRSASLWPLVALEVAVAVFLVQRAQGDAILARVRAGATDEPTLSALSAAEPWRPEPALARLAASWDPAAADAAAARFVDDGATQLRLAALAVQQGDVARAAAWLDRSLVRDPNDVRAWRLSAALRLAAGDRAGAAEAWAEALIRWPPDSVGDPEVFDQAYALRPVGLWWVDRLQRANAVWSIRLADRMLAEHRPETAWLACEQASTIRPRIYRWNRPCAEARVALHRDDEALAYLQAWTEDRDDDFWSWWAAAKVAPSIAGDAAKGLWQRALVQAWALSPGHPRLCALLTPLRETCDTEPESLQPGTCALVDVARRGRGTPGAAWLARQPAFVDHADDPGLWERCP